VPVLGLAALRLRQLVAIPVQEPLPLHHLRRLAIVLQQEHFLLGLDRSDQEQQLLAILLPILVIDPHSAEIRLGQG